MLAVPCIPAVVSRDVAARANVDDLNGDFRSWNRHDARLGAIEFARGPADGLLLDGDARGRRKEDERWQPSRVHHPAATSEAAVLFRGVSTGTLAVASRDSAGAAY
jgi:hypothetical protein